MRDPMGFRGVRPVDRTATPSGAAALAGSGETGQGGQGRAPVEDRHCLERCPLPRGECRAEDSARREEEGDMR